jgi:hypothetical protein
MARLLGRGQIVEVSDETVYVVVHRPHGGPYRFGAPPNWFEAAGEKQWRLNMPATTRSEFMRPEGEPDPTLAHHWKANPNHSRAPLRGRLKTR